MKFTVVWAPSAEDHLAELWMRAADQQAVSDSANRIDRELREGADRKGIEFGPFRAFLDDPLSVLYIVEAQDCRVRVIQVRRNA